MSVAVELDRDLNIVVLMGGWSAERPVSLMSGNGVVEALGEKVRRRVQDKTNMTLEWEIQRIGVE